MLSTFLRLSSTFLLAAFNSASAFEASLLISVVTFSIGASTLTSLAFLSPQALIRPIAITANIIDFLISTLNDTENIDIQRGCPLGNLLQEALNYDEDFAEILTKILNNWKETFLVILQKAVQNNELKDDIQIINFNKDLFYTNAEKIICFDKATEYLKTLLMLLDEDEGESFLEINLFDSTAYSNFKKYLLEINEIDFNITCEKLRNIILKNISN